MDEQMAAPESTLVLADDAGAQLDERTLCIVVAIVTYNSADHIRQCLTSLRAAASGEIELRINVVDNASSDETVQIISAEYPEVDLFASATNDGFARSTNRSLKSMSADADYALVLNPDTQLRPGVLESLVDVMQKFPDAAVVGCRLELANGEFDHASKRSFPDPIEAVKYFVQKQLHLPQSSSYLAQHVGEREFGSVDAVNGALMFVRPGAMAEVGLFDERYWMYAEDLDWCRRFQTAGWKTYYQGRTVSTHLKGASSGKYRNLKVNWHFHYSMIIFYSKFDAGNSRVKDAGVYWTIIAKFGFSAVWSAVIRAGRRTMETLVRS